MSRKVLFIPGYPGTDLLTTGGEKVFLDIKKILAQRSEFLRQLEGPDDLGADDGIVAGDPVEHLVRILHFDLVKQASSLYDILGNLGVTPVKFGYDWRRPVWDPGMQARLKAAVTGLSPAGSDKIVAIVHSTGGLVLRYFLENHPSLARRFERIVAFGVPWAGLLKALRFLAGKDKFVLISREKAQRIVAHSWAGFDLLPPDPERTDMTDAAGQPLNLVVDGNGRQTSPLIKRGWFPAELAEAMELRASKVDEMLGAANQPLGEHHRPWSARRR